MVNIIYNIDTNIMALILYKPNLLYIYLKSGLIYYSNLLYLVPDLFIAKSADKRLSNNITIQLSPFKPLFNIINLPYLDLHIRLPLAKEVNY